MKRIHKRTGRIIEFVMIEFDNIHELRERAEGSVNQIFVNESDYIFKYGHAPFNGGAIIQFPALGRENSLVPLWGNPYIGFKEDGNSQAWSAKAIREETVKNNLFNRFRYGK